jgi:Flp pilus assembly protein TadD
MLVFLVLADRRGEVVNRSQFFEEIWSGVPVGDDSLNRSIGQVRKALQSAIPGQFTLETIPRTGYSLAIEDGRSAQPRDDRWDRRSWLLAGSATLAAAAGAIFFVRRKDSSSEASEFKERGRQIIRAAIPREEDTAVNLLSRAVELSPRDPEAWGLLALAYRGRVENGSPDIVTLASRECERAAGRALDLDPKEGNALTALAAMAPEYGNWLENERALRRVLAKAPDNVPALNFLTLLLQGVGRCEASFDLNERALKLDPRDSTPLWRLAMKNWIFGQPEKADQVLTRALEMWPHHPAIWNTRLMTFAYTGRPREALEYIRSRPKPLGRSERSIRLWEMTLTALATSDATVRNKARDELIEEGARSTGQSTHAVMALSGLGFIDDAFHVAEGYFGLRGKFVVAQKKTLNEVQINDNGWKRTMMLFTPVTRPMRLDPRFDGLMKLTGIADYWKASNIAPDAFLFR